MFKDDRMMSMLTVVVVLIAVGTLVQRADVFERFLNGGGEKFAYIDDEVIVRANELSEIDVLANDTGIEEGDVGRLLVIAQPECGRAFAEDGVVRYLPPERCAGVQTLHYAVSGRGNMTGEVRVTVRLAEVAESVAENAELDTPAPQPQAPAPEPAAASESASAPAAPAAPQANGTTSGAVAQAPVVPKPEAPTITELPESARGASLGGSGNGVGLARESAGTAPRVVDTADPLTGDRLSAARPDIVLPVTPDEDAGPGAGASTPEVSRETPAGADRATVTADGSGAPAAAGSTESTVALRETDETGAGGIEPSADAPGTRTGTEPVANDAAPPDDELASETTVLARGSAPDDGSGSIQATEPQTLAGAAVSEPETEAPDSAVAILRQDETPDLAPVDTTAPPELRDPDTVGTSAALEEASETATGTGPTAAAPRAEPCDLPPSLTLDARAAAITYAIIESPCHANTVAEIGYEGLRLAIEIDGAGTGTIAAPGFQHASDATIRFADGTQLDFNIAFIDTEKMDRVAVAAGARADLQLHAFEFGAEPGSPGHVGPANPRRHDDVRRTGGGYLLAYSPVGGIGQSVEIYTFWHRRRGGKGVVHLDLGLEQSGGAGACGATGGGAAGSPDYLVLRSEKGTLHRPRLGLLGQFDCASLAASGGFVPDAIDDIVVRKR